jgi:hypothetical protein
MVDEGYGPGFHSEKPLLIPQGCARPSLTRVRVQIPPPRTLALIRNALQIFKSDGVSQDDGGKSNVRAKTWLADQHVFRRLRVSTLPHAAY